MEDSSAIDTRTQIWLDCDPGHDDAIAIILAGHNPKVSLIGISTVAGNQTVEKVTENTLRLLYWSGLGKDVDVFKGQGRPLLRAGPILCPEIHGDTGLDGPLGGPVLPPAPGLAVQPGKAPIAMYERISAAYENNNQRKVQLVATGALTNVALLLTLYPEISPMIEIVIMGGCLGLGNTGPVVEFNIQTDPEAARIVFNAGIKLTMVPLEVTHTALATGQVLEAIRGKDPGSSFLNLMVDMLTFFAKTYKAIFNFNDPPLHDPCAVAYVIAPHIFQTEHLRVDIETHSRLSAGQTVVDVWRQTDKPPNCHVCMSMDLDRFWEMVVDALHAADNVCPAM